MRAGPACLALGESTRSVHAVKRPSISSSLMLSKSLEHPGERLAIDRDIISFILCIQNRLGE